MAGCMSAEGRALTTLLVGLERETSEDEIDVAAEWEWWALPVHERLRRILAAAEKELANG